MIDVKADRKEVADLNINKSNKSDTEMSIHAIEALHRMIQHV